ncbi:MAG: DMT family transporter [Methylobacteriaceae bacterium]|nr:DMT family transporter [Methylobacteriaceae bacterium]
MSALETSSSSAPPASPARAASAPAAPSRARLAGAAVAFTILTWASAFPLIRLALRDLAPLPLAALRFAVAAGCVLLWLAAARPPRPTGRHLLRFGLCGLVGIALYNGLLNAGQRSVTAGAASFIVNTLPIITAILATLFLGERFKLWGWIGTGISFAGIALIASGQPGGLAFGAGASLILAAATCQAVYFILQRPLVPRYGALAATAYTLLAGAILLAPWLPEAIRTVAAPGASPTTLPAVVALGVLPAALGYAAWTYALGHFGAARAANFLYLVPPVATALAFLIAGEVPAPTTLAGGAVAVAGVIVVNTRGRG